MTAVLQVCSVGILHLLELCCALCKSGESRHRYSVDTGVCVSQVTVILGDYASFGSGFACPPGTGVLSFITHGCSAATSYCPAGSVAAIETPIGSYAIATHLVLFFNTSVCEAGR